MATTHDTTSAFHNSKICANPQCPHKGVRQPLSAYYVRSGVVEPSEPGHYLSECKACMKGRNNTLRRLPAQEPRAATEKLAITYLHQHGVHALPGKAVHAADVDVVAWGGVWLEVKHAKQQKLRGHNAFSFTTTHKQQQRGFLAHLVLLICEYPNGTRTFHLFEATDPVFYMHDRIKSGFVFRVGSTGALKHGASRVVMTQAMMDAARDRLSLIPQVMRGISKGLRTEELTHV